MIRKDHAIALHIVPYSRTSHVVTWLTAHGGRLATLSKGALRPRSLLLGQYDNFYTCEILFYDRARENLRILRECTALTTRVALRSGWKATACASYLCDLVRRALYEGRPETEIYALLEKALDALCRAPAHAGIVLWFEVHLLRHLGVSPQLGACLACGRPIQSVSRATALSCARGGILCPPCARASPPQGESERISPAARRLLRNWQASAEPPDPPDGMAPGREAGRLLGMFLAYHLDLRLQSRRIAAEVLAMREEQG